MAKIRSISPSTQRVKAHPTEADCQFAVVYDDDGTKILHLSTFGSDNRVSAPKSSQSIQLDYPVAEQLLELLIDTFKLSPGGSTDIVWKQPALEVSVDEGASTRLIDEPVPLPSTQRESTMNPRVAALIGGEQFARQYQQFSPRFSPLSIGMLLTLLMESNGQSSYAEVAAVLGIRPARVRQSMAVLSQVINQDDARILSENGIEVLLNSALLFEHYEIGR